jgi:deubiquitinase DESI2
VALPCVVPRDWIEPPDYGTADGELIEDDTDEEGLNAHESTGFLSRSGSSRDRFADSDSDSERVQLTSSRGNDKGKGKLKDTSGRVLPPSERAPGASRA